MTNCQPMTGLQVNSAFLAGAPLIDKQILDLTIKHPNWMRDVYQTEPFPLGSGTSYQQLIYRGSLPEREEGFGKWKTLNNNTGCAPDCGPDCSYNWSRFGTHGFDRKVLALMSRDFRTEDFCVKEIQTTKDFRDVFSKIIENVYRQIDYIKEVNIGQNALTSFTKKFVVDSNGPQANTQNPYVYRPKGTATLSILNMQLLEYFYEWMCKIPDCIPYDVQDGQPIFALACSRQLFAHLYRDDANLRQDVRFSSDADAMLRKYNFISSIRGMFLPVPIQWPRRFNWTGAAWVQVNPTLNGIPAEVGSYTGINPAYEMAQYEEVLAHGKYPFKVMYLPTEQTLGENSSFGPEANFFEALQWINPQTPEDPYRRVGYYATSATIGISAQFSEGAFGFLVPRPSVRDTAVFAPEPECPPDAVECDNSVPALSCPCPIILSVTANPTVSGRFFFQFNVPLDAEVLDTVQLGLDTGGYLTGTVQSISSDGFTAELSFTSTCPSCSHFVSIYCSDSPSPGCSADVNSACSCAASTEGGSTPAISLVLKRPIKAEALDVVTVFFCDGSSAGATVQTVDVCTNTYTVTLDSDDVSCLDTNSIVTVCVPPSTDATCPACGSGITVTYCS